MKPTAGDDAAAISTLRSKDEDDEENDEGKTLSNTVGNDDEDADGIVISDKVEVIPATNPMQEEQGEMLASSTPLQNNQRNTFLDCMNSQEVAEASLTQQATVLCRRPLLRRTQTLAWTRVLLSKRRHLRCRAAVKSCLCSLAPAINWT